jgi:hypothetical protein
VIAPLKASERVAAECLEMPRGLRCKAYLLPCRGNGKALEALDVLRGPHRPALGVAIDEPASAAMPVDAEVGGVHIPEAMRSQ